MSFFQNLLNFSCTLIRSLCLCIANLCSTWNVFVVKKLIKMFALALVYSLLKFSKIVIFLETWSLTNTGWPTVNWCPPPPALSIYTTRGHEERRSNNRPGRRQDLTGALSESNLVIIAVKLMKLWANKSLIHPIIMMSLFKACNIATLGPTDRLLAERPK